MPHNLRQTHYTTETLLERKWDGFEREVGKLCKGEDFDSHRSTYVWLIFFK